MMTAFRIDRARWKAPALLLAVVGTGCSSGLVAADDTVSTARGVPVLISVLGNDEAAVAVSATGKPAHGSVSINTDGTVKYTPEPGFHGQDSFTYTAKSGSGQEAEASVGVTVLEAGVVVAGRLHRVEWFSAGPGPFTYPTDINASGAVIGSWLEANGAQHGFLRTPGGTFQAIEYPGAKTTLAEGINDDGTIVGQYFGEDGLPHGFKRTASGQWEPYDVPGSAVTYVQDITNDGRVVGASDTQVQDDPDLRARHGYVRAANGEVTAVDMPGASRTYVLGVNASGGVVGFYDAEAGGRFGFHGTVGGLQKIDPPGAAGFTVTPHIDDSGEVLGFFMDANFFARGFVLKDGTSHVFELPAHGAFLSTNAYRRNASGSIVGWTSNASFSAAKGFLTTPVDAGAAASFR